MSKPEPTQEVIDLDELLEGKPTWEQVVAFWRAVTDGTTEFYNEHYQVDAIKKHLRTEEQRKKMFELDVSIEEILGGRYPRSKGRAVDAILKEWNKKLGFRAFNV